MSVPRARTFTLIELMVVTTIVVIITALLIPVVFEAQGRSREVMCSANMHDIVAGISQHAEDNAGALPDGIGDSEFLQPHAFQSNRHDLRAVAENYNFLKSTAHPGTGAPAWHHPGNKPVAGWQNSLWGSWSYLPGWLLMGDLMTSMNLDECGPGAIILQDTVRVRGDGVTEQVTHCRSFSRFWDGSSEGAPSMRFYDPNTPKDIRGHHAAMADGSVVLFAQRDATFIRTADWGWQIGHFQRARF